MPAKQTALLIGKIAHARKTWEGLSNVLVLKVLSHQSMPYSHNNFCDNSRNTVQALGTISFIDAKPENTTMSASSIDLMHRQL
jgi:hypothetical protein